ncbi:hypothetical protein RI367_004118 [Sorochytrium milnesiophthora]
MPEESNPYAQTFRSIWEQRGHAPNLANVLIDEDKVAATYLLGADEIAAVVVGQDNTDPAPRNIVQRRRQGGKPKRVSDMHTVYAPQAHVLLYLQCEDGWFQILWSPIFDRHREQNEEDENDGTAGDRIYVTHPMFQVFCLQYPLGHPGTLLCGNRQCRHPNNGRSVRRGNQELDNHWVAPHHPLLTVKYTAHIYVKVWTTLSAVKYLFR